MLEVVMDGHNSSKIHIRQDSPTGISSRAHGSSVDALAFNLTVIATKNPALAIEIMKLYSEAHKITLADEPYPEEDFSTMLDKLKELFQ